MTTPAHTHTTMSPPPDTPQTPTPHEAAATAAAATPSRSLTANALLAALTAVVTVMAGALTTLLVHEFNSIDDKFAAVDARFAAVDAKLDSLEAGQAEIARTLAVLVAELNARCGRRARWPAASTRRRRPRRVPQRRAIGRILFGVDELFQL